jgi:hypothetical protein
MAGFVEGIDRGGAHWFPPLFDVTEDNPISTRVSPFVSFANRVAMNVIEANRINIIDTPAVPPM